MSKHKKNESGFSIVELLFIIVILALIGVAGYFVASHINKKTNQIISQQFQETPSNSSNEYSSKNAISFCIKSVSNENSGYSEIIEAKSGYLDLQAVGLELPVSGKLSNLLAVCSPPINMGISLMQSPPLVTSYSFSTSSLENAYSACTPDNPDSLGVLNILSSYYQGTPTDDTWGQYIVQVGKYYLYYQPPQGECYPDINGGELAVNLQQQLQLKLTSVFSNISSD